MNIQLYDTPRVQEAMGGRELCGLSTVARDDVCILKTAKVLKEHFLFWELTRFFLLGLLHEMFAQCDSRIINVNST